MKRFLQKVKYDGNGWPAAQFILVLNKVDQLAWNSEEVIITTGYVSSEFV